MAWAPDYITSAELKAYKRIGDAVDDTEVAQAITGAARAIDRATARQFGQVATAEARIYTPEWDRRRNRWLIAIDDLDTTTGFALEIDGTAVTDYTLEPRNAVAKGMVWTQLVLGLDAEATPSRSDPTDAAEATGKWGWTATPTAVKLANKLQASRFLARRESPFGVAGSPQDGSELRLLAMVDPDVKVALGKYVRVWGAV
jgi:hypothetical protein